MKRIFFTVNLALAFVLFLTMVALSSADSANAQRGGGTAAARQTELAATANAARDNAGATAEAVQQNTQATSQAAQTSIASTREAVVDNRDATATYIATAIQQTREDYQATATVVFAQLENEIAEQVADLLAALGKEGILVDVENEMLFVTVERTEAQTAAIINAALDETQYASVTATVDYIAPDMAVVGLLNVPTEGGRTVDYTLTYVLVYDIATNTYSLVLTDIKINGVSVPMDQVEQALVEGVSAVLEAYTIDVDALVNNAATTTPDYSLSHVVQDAYMTNTSYVLSFIIDLTPATTP
jgi:hypothetical protein